MKLSHFIPPVITHFLKKILKKESSVWSGNYNSWNDANLRCSGYDQMNILDQCAHSLKQVVSGTAAYERDSVVFDKIQYSWGVLAGLQKAAIENNLELCVLDFGGSLGSSYYQNRSFLGLSVKIKWCIVEQSNFVEYGKANFETDELKFYYTIEECLAAQKPTVLLLSSVLQYMEKPNDWINKFCELNIAHVIIDRTAFTLNSDSFITIQKVPDVIYKASYPMWFFSKTNFLRKFKESYTVIGEFESFCDKPTTINNNEPVYWAGFTLQKK